MDTTVSPRQTAPQVGDPEPERPRRARPALRERRTGDLAALLQRRPELRGVHAWADEMADYVRWSA